MKRLLAISGAGVLAFVAIAALAGMSPSPASWVGDEIRGARPGGDLPLLLKLNGTPTPFKLPDAGWAGFSGSGIQCMKGLNPGDTLKFTPNAEVWVCAGSLDGGCQIGTTAPLDPNSGDDAPAATAYYVTLPDYSAAWSSMVGGGSVPFTSAAAFSDALTGYQLCEVPTTGSVSFSVFVMR